MGIEFIYLLIAIGVIIIVDFIWKKIKTPSNNSESLVVKSDALKRIYHSFKTKSGLYKKINIGLLIGFFVMTVLYVGGYFIVDSLKVKQKVYSSTTYNPASGESWENFKDFTVYKYDWVEWVDDNIYYQTTRCCYDNSKFSFREFIDRVLIRGGYLVIPFTFSILFILNILLNILIIGKRYLYFLKRKKNIILFIIAVLTIKLFLHFFIYTSTFVDTLKYERFEKTYNQELSWHLNNIFVVEVQLFIPVILFCLFIAWYFNDKIKAK